MLLHDQHDKELCNSSGYDIGIGLGSELVLG